MAACILVAQRIGIVGLGRMGMPICTRLAGHAGFEVTAYDQRAELEPETIAAGAGWAESARAVAAEADALITVLPGPAEVSAALRGAKGALAGLRSGATWIDMSTCAPAAGQALAAEARARGVRCLDAPLGGDPSGAGAGRLQFFVGGRAGDVEDQRGVLEALADPRDIRHVGDHGAGYMVKLLVNLLWFGQAIATAEALLLAGKAGLDLTAVREALAGSAASSQFIRSDLGSLMDGDYLASFGLDRCVEELRSITDTARDVGAPYEVANVVEGIYRRALQRYGPVDGELLAVALLEDETGLRIRHSQAGSHREA